MTTSINQEELVLFAHHKLYNGSRYKFYHDERDYDTWLISSSDTYMNLTVNYKSLSEPIRLNVPEFQLDKFTYGSLTNSYNGTFKKYYIFIDSITTNQDGVTELRYSIDWWATYFNELLCTKANVTRKSLKPLYMPQPFSPLNSDYSIVSVLNNEPGVILFTYSDPDTSQMRFGVLSFDDTTLELIETGAWNDTLGIPDGDLFDVFIVPLFQLQDFITSGFIQTHIEREGTVYASFYSSMGNGSGVLPSKNIMFPSAITSSEVSVLGISDWNGNSIWECPYGVEISGFTVKINIDMTHCKLRFIYNNEYGSEIVGKGFTYECRHGTILVDMEREYTWRDRKTEIDMRKIQSDKQVWTVASDAIQGTGFGLAFGQAAGAKAAGVGGAINVVSTFLMNEYFDPKIQATTDLKYHRMADYISVVGDSISPLYDRVSSTNKLCLVPIFENTENLSNEDVIREYNTHYSSYLVNGDVIYLANIKTSERNFAVQHISGDFHLLNGNIINSEKCVYSNGNISRSSSETLFLCRDYNDEPDYTDSQITELYKQYKSVPIIGDTVYIMYATNRSHFLVYDGSTWTKLGQFDTYNRIRYYPTYYSYWMTNIVSLTAKTSGSIPLGLKMYIYRLQMDASTIIRMVKDITTNGYYCDEVTENLQSYFGIGKIVQAYNTTIEGPVNLEAKYQVNYRLQNGVEFI